MRWKNTFRNIPRELNSAADDMCRRAEASLTRVELAAGEVQRLGAPEVSLTAIYEQQEASTVPTRPSVATLLLQASSTFLEAAGKPCGVCHWLEGESDMVMCDR